MVLTKCENIKPQEKKKKLREKFLQKKKTTTKQNYVITNQDVLKRPIPLRNNKNGGLKIFLPWATSSIYKKVFAKSLYFTDTLERYKCKQHLPTTPMVSTKRNAKRFFNALFY